MQSEYFKGKKILITAGPTYEKIDPVRYIGNYSSGKMGFAIAEELAASGAEVFLVSGPTHIKKINPSIVLTNVESALEMYETCISIFPDCQMAIMAAAVADYRPAELQSNKIKKTEEEITLKLIRNPDILASLGRVKKEGQRIVGFALETNNELENAKSKLHAKNADAIILNSLNVPGAGFKHDTNQVSIIFKKDIIFEFPLKEKTLLAKDIIQCISENID